MPIEPTTKYPVYESISECPQSASDSGEYLDYIPGWGKIMNHGDSNSVMATTVLENRDYTTLQINEKLPFRDLVPNEPELFKKNTDENTVTNYEFVETGSKLSYFALDEKIDLLN